MASFQWPQARSQVSSRLAVPSVSQGNSQSWFLSSKTCLQTDARDEWEFTNFLFAKGKGKGNVRPSGKGFGRRKNPRDKEGKVRTGRVCGSDEQFAREWPQANPKTHFSGGGSSSEYGPYYDANRGYFTGRVQTTHVLSEDVPLGNVQL